MRLLLAFAVGVVLFWGTPGFAQDEARKCVERCEQDYSGCGSDPSDPCNKAKQSCLDTCRSAHPQNVDETGQPQQ